MSVIPTVGFFICIFSIFMYTYIHSLNECMFAFMYVCVLECTYVQQVLGGTLIKDKRGQFPGSGVTGNCEIPT